MQKNLIKIKFIPNTLTKNLYRKSYQDLKFIGNKSISKFYTVPLIELLNRERIYLLKNEIIKQNLNKYREIS